MKLVISILSSFLILACNSTYNYFSGYDSKLILINRTKKHFWAGYSYNYPDTSIILYNDSDSYPDFFSYKNNDDTLNCSLKLGKWEGFFYGKDSAYKLILFVFNQDTIDQNNWSGIQRDYLIYKRFMFTKKQLDSLNWRIIID